MGDKLEPLSVLYCGVCGLPPDFCEFGPEFDKCKPWLAKNAPEIYPELQRAAEEATDGIGSLSIAETQPGPSSQDSQTTKEEAVKKLPGGKVKKKDKKEIIVEKVTRNKRKAITTIRGLELFGIKLAEASKKLGKKFASGASVVKNAAEKEQIDVQGDILYDCVDFLTNTWPEIKESDIFFIEDGKKVPAA